MFTASRTTHFILLQTDTTSDHIISHGSKWIPLRFVKAFNVSDKSLEILINNNNKMCLKCGDRVCVFRWRTWLAPCVMIFYGIVLVIALPFLIIHLQTSGAHPHDKAWFIGGMFVLLTLPLSFWGIVQHLVHFSKPHLQKHVIRILWMVPIYALNAWLGLWFPQAAIYLDTCRECYEAYVIYNFMIFLLNYLHIEMGLEEQLGRKPPVKHFCPLCCLAPWEMGRTLIDRCRFGILQYTVVRPITTVIALICEIVHVYGEGEFSPKVAYPYLVLINNISQFMAMYSLIFFYKAHATELAPMKPLSKFLCIKSVVFFSFFQSVIISILVNTGVISESFTTKDDKVIKAVASSLQDFLICIEMFLAALAHLYAFNYKPYVDPNNEPAPCWQSFLSMWDVSDVRQDVSDHIRGIGSSVQRSVVRQKPIPETSPDERTCLLQPEQREISGTREGPMRAPRQLSSSSVPPNSPAKQPSTMMDHSTSDSDDEGKFVRGSGSMERSLIDFSSDANC